MSDGDMMNQRSNYIKILYILIVLVLCFVISFPIKVYADEYEYDPEGRLVKVVHDDGSYTEYEYDSNGNIISITEWQSNDLSVKDEQNTDNNDPDKNEITENDVKTSVNENDNISNSESQINSEENKQGFGETESEPNSGQVIEIEHNSELETSKSDINNISGDDTKIKDTSSDNKNGQKINESISTDRNSSTDDSFQPIVVLMLLGISFIFFIVWVVLKNKKE